MNASGQIAESGFSTLLVFNGESLSYLSGTVDAVVNRNVVKGKDFLAQHAADKIDFSVLGLTEIEVLKTAVVGRPEDGHFFRDGIGYRHRVRFVTQTDVTWVCYCTPSEV